MDKKLFDKACEQLIEKGLIKEQKLPNGSTYYILTEKGENQELQLKEKVNHEL